MKKIEQNKQAFTLVELIVVIIILSILGTITFINLQGYSSKARDSKRISDIQNIKKGLELFSLKTGKYPLPDNFSEVTYGEEKDLVWTQGIIGKKVGINLSKNLSKKPIDPLTEKEYIYSTTVRQTKYEILSVYESNLLSGNYFGKKIYAKEPIYAKVEGTYNGLYVKTKNYYVATPSIITSAEITGGLELTGETIKSQIITGGKNLIGNNKVLKGNLNIKMSAYTGSIDGENIETEGIKFIKSLQKAYSGSVLGNKDTYKKLLEIDITDNQQVKKYIKTVVLKKKNYTTKEKDLTPKSPINLSLVHDSGKKYFKFGWTGGKLNTGGCKLQYLKNGTSWENINSKIYNCDINLSDEIVELPSDGWNNHWSSVAVRVVRVKDDLELATFEQKLTCSSVSGSSSKTPNIDENCNGKWDDLNTIFCNKPGCSSGKYCTKVCNSYKSGGCQGIGGSCRKRNGSRVYVYSWYHNYTMQRLHIGYSSPTGCGSSKCTTVVSKGYNCTYSGQCGTEYR